MQSRRQLTACRLDSAGAGPGAVLLPDRKVTPSRPCDGAMCCAATRCDGATERCNAVSAGAVETGERIANETADRLIGNPGRCPGAFVALLRNHAEIVRAHANVNRRRPQQEFRRSDLHKGVGEKKADGLRLLIVIGACGTLTTAFRDRL